MSQRAVSFFFFFSLSPCAEWQSCGKAAALQDLAANAARLMGQTHQTDVHALGLSMKRAVYSKELGELRRSSIYIYQTHNEAQADDVGVEVVEWNVVWPLRRDNGYILVDHTHCGQI